MGIESLVEKNYDISKLKKLKYLDPDRKIYFPMHMMKHIIGTTERKVNHFLQNEVMTFRNTEYRKGKYVHENDAIYMMLFFKMQRVFTPQKMRELLPIIIAKIESIGGPKPDMIIFFNKKITAISRSKMEIIFGDFEDLNSIKLLDFYLKMDQFR